ncbi:MAG: hypothetical protein HOO98_13790 [Nitrospira sp.]|nr:hypothetical protein [Nitrospira sp.]
MTGQASALFQNIRFESGVVKATEIDRFGQTVRYDDGQQKHKLTGESVPHSPVVKTGQEFIACSNGNPALQRSYLIGPEGIREIDPNERLIMAMYSDAKPLIDSLKDLSAQRVNQDAEQLLPFDLDLSKARAEAALSALKNNKNSDQDPGSLPSPSVFAERLLPLFTDGGLR